MSDGATIHIEKLAIHVLDNAKESAVLSDRECDITPEIDDFFVAHIANSIADENSKRAVFSQEDATVKTACDKIFERGSRFIANSKRMAEELFRPMRQTRTISAG